MEIKEVIEEVKQHESMEDVEYCCRDGVSFSPYEPKRVDSFCMVLIKFTDGSVSKASLAKNKLLYKQCTIVVNDIVGIPEEYKSYYFYPDAINYMLNKRIKFERITSVKYVKPLKKK